jgi:hypothetical protein
MLPLFCCSFFFPFVVVFLFFLQPFSYLSPLRPEAGSGSCPGVEHCVQANQFANEVDVAHVFFFSRYALIPPTHPRTAAAPPPRALLGGVALCKLSRSSPSPSGRFARLDLKTDKRTTTDVARRPPSCLGNKPTTQRPSSSWNLCEHAQ